ncbi:signal peptidase I [Lachnoclostridium sp. An131]|uniref:signal peptidase I n=1 Tax=Lachnoclostridium sp. An131 TaxID=1965555 RepID=UPI000B38E996|nr:signal peptidase I [Lachnoclostridium sp. An131]OUQ27169.1 signal peptidase I [Lachnoclostridium sp. An131]
MFRRRKKEEPEFEEEENRKGPLRELLGMLIYIGIVLAVTFLIITFVGQRTHVSGESMENTLDDGDQLIVDKITYRFQDPERFDIIVFPFHYKENTYYIKRIIGLPGETVQIADGTIYIDGEVLQESYGREVMQDPGIAAEPITLGEDEYFVLGDNRNQSSDSRDPSVGLIHRDEIIGRAWLRIWPLDSFGILKHQ